MSKEDKHLTTFEVRAMTVLEEKGPLWSAGVGEAVWPDSNFKNAQGAALAGGGLMGRLAKLGLVERKYERGLVGDLRFKGWALTAKGRAALKEVK